MLKAAYLVELEKLWRRKKYVVLIALDAVFCLLTAVSHLLAGIIADGVFTNFDFFDGLLVNGFAGYLGFFLPLIALLGAADLFSGEYHDRSLRMVFQRPVERWKLFLAKVGAVYTVTLVCLAVHFVVLFLLKLAFGRTLAGTSFAVAAYLFDILPLFVVVLFFAGFHQLVNSPGTAVALSVVVYLAIFFVGKYVTVVGGLVFTEFLSWHSLWLGSTLPLSALLPKIGILLGSGTIFYCVGYELFNRKEI